MPDEKREESKLARAGRIALEEIAASKALALATSPSDARALEVTLQASVAAVASLAKVAEPLAEAALKQAASIADIFRSKLSEREERRVAMGLLAAAEARGQAVEQLARELDARSDEDWTQTHVRETSRAMVDALDPAVIPSLGRLLAEYLGPPSRPPDALLRGLARLLADCGEGEHFVLARIFRQLGELASLAEGSGVWSIEIQHDDLHVRPVGPKGGGGAEPRPYHLPQSHVGAARSVLGRLGQLGLATGSRIEGKTALRIHRLLTGPSK